MRSRLLTAVILVFIMAIGFALRYDICSRSLGNGYNIFDNISAFHYYFAYLVAKGERIPVVSYKAQYPEGIYVFRRLSIFMEYFTGLAYRAFKRLGVDFNTFVGHAVRFLGVLPAVIVYHLSGALTKRKAPALFSSLFYVVTPAALKRSAGLGFLRENFALPFIFAHILFLVLADRKGKSKSNVYLTFSGITLFVALASWHFTQFYLAAFFLFLALRRLSSYGSIDKRSYLVCLLTSFAAGLVIPYLEANRFVLSWPMILGYSIAPLFLTDERTKRSRRGFGILRRRSFLKSKKVTLFFTSLLIFLALTALLFFLTDHFITYAHVYSLGIDAVRFLGIKPDIPGLISSDSRMLWGASHGSPSGEEVVSLFLPLFILTLPLILYGLTVRITKGQGRGEYGYGYQLVFFFMILFGILYLFVSRLSVFVVFFLSLFAGAIAAMQRRRLLRIAAYLLVVSAIFFEIHRMNHATIYTEDKLATFEFLDWVRKNTDENAVFLAPPRYSPEILAYTGRPINLHAKLESSQIRQKTIEWAESLFTESEVPLYDICRRWSTDYVVFVRGTYTARGKNSWRYITDNLDADKEAIGYILEKGCEERSVFSFNSGGAAHKGKISRKSGKANLEHFSLVFDNGTYKVYSVI